MQAGVSGEQHRATSERQHDVQCRIQNCSRYRRGYGAQVAGAGPSFRTTRGSFLVGRGDGPRCVCAFASKCGRRGVASSSEDESDVVKLESDRTTSTVSFGLFFERSRNAMRRGGTAATGVASRGLLSIEEKISSVRCSHGSMGVIDSDARPPRRFLVAFSS